MHKMVGPIPGRQSIDNGTVFLVTIDENHAPLFANGHMLQLYHKIISKDAFTSHIAVDPEYQLERGKKSFSTLVNH